MLTSQTRQAEKCFQLERGAVHVWHADLSCNDMEVSWAADILDGYERSRASTYRSRKDQTEYIVSHGIVRLILARHLGCAPGSLQFGYTAKGKPYIVEPSNTSELKFSLARSAGVGVFAFSSRDVVGIDVELIAEDAISEDAFEFALSVKEKCLIAAQPNWPEKVKSFLTLWTRKEAFLKARGDGLGTRPADIDVSVSSANGSIQERCVSQDSWCVRSLIFNRHHLSAVALQRSAFDVTLRKFDLSTLRAAQSRLTEFV